MLNPFEVSMVALSVLQESEKTTLSLKDLTKEVLNEAYDKDEEVSKKREYEIRQTLLNLEMAFPGTVEVQRLGQNQGNITILRGAVAKDDPEELQSSGFRPRFREMEY